MFRLGLGKSDRSQDANQGAAPYLTVFAPEIYRADRDGMAALQWHAPDGSRCEVLRPPESADEGDQQRPIDTEFALSLFVDPAQLDGVADQVLAARKSGRSTTLIVAINSGQLTALGQWLERRAAAGRLCGTRLIVASDVFGVVRQLRERMAPVTEDNVIRMPATTEVENNSFKNFYVFSPSLQALVARVRGFAKNGVTKACLLGGPGSGKTTIAYYYYLVRAKGAFISVNLAAENTGDKAAVKSLLCGHVVGAFPGAGSRNGAITSARDGVCFLDESHQINGALMEVMMEVLDSGQYMPFGASAKREMQCALLYATNRGWSHLQKGVNLDEFTRMGAATLQVPPLAAREEDMIAVAAATLARLAQPCTDWKAPIGLSAEAWKLLRECPWHGNIRGMIRVLESAFVDTATKPLGDGLIQAAEVEQGIQRWEPKTHHSHQIYEAA